MSPKKEIPYGYCQCGCGQKTNPYRKTWMRKGEIKGEPSHFIRGHHCKNGNRSLEKNSRWSGGTTIALGGYIRVKAPDHHRANNHGYVLVHILVAEEVLGKPIPRSVEVHHVNGNPMCNLKNNLVICQDGDYHKLLHKRKRAVIACGHAHWRRCRYCGQWDDPKNMAVYGPRVAEHKHCSKLNRQKRKGAIKPSP